MDQYVIYWWNIAMVIVLIPYIILLSYLINHKRYWYVGLHMGISTLMCLGFLHITYWLNISMILAPITAFFIGFLKEVYDFLHPKKRRFCLMDLLYDFIGVMIGIIIAFMYFKSLNFVLL